MLAFALLGAEWVLWLLVGLSVLCVGVAVERTIYSIMNKSPSAAFQGALEGFLQGGEAGQLHASLKDMGGVQARVISTGVEAGLRGGPAAAEEAITGAMTFERLKMERGLIILGTVGSNAPFIGLFGTVLGIIRAFKDLSLENAEAAGSVMAGISEALVATAVGLLVAIPAVVLYNWFQRRNKETLGQLQSLGHLVLSRFHVKPAQPGS